MVEKRLENVRLPSVYARVRGIPSRNQQESNNMTTPKRSPAPKTTPTATKKATPTKKRAAKDAATAATAKALPRERDPRLRAIGTTITKEWHGKTMEVKCLADGFEFKGTTFKSLSALAKEASGFASVNGFLFFGLIPREAAKDKPAKETPAKTKGAKPATVKIGGESNEVATPAGQRAALAAAGLTKKAKGAK